MTACSWAAPDVYTDWSGAARLSEMALPPQSKLSIVSRAVLIVVSIIKNRLFFLNRLGSSRIEVTTFSAYTHSNDQVGSDGLPLVSSPRPHSSHLSDACEGMHAVHGSR